MTYEMLNGLALDTFETSIFSHSILTMRFVTHTLVQNRFFKKNLPI